MRALLQCRWVALAAGLLLSSAWAEERAVTLEALLQEMVDREAVARWPQPAYTCRQASSYDRRTKSPDDPAGWFANTDNMDGSGASLRWEEAGGRRECVLLDVEGPGCIVRFWSGGQQPKGKLRFYLDGAAQPAIEAPMQDLMSGKLFVPPPLAILNAGNALNLYLPVPYAKHCKITYDESRPGNPNAPPPGRWYNIEYRSYPAGTGVKSFTMDDYAACKATIERVCKMLLEPPALVGGWDFALDAALEPGQEASTDLPLKQGAVRVLEARLDGVPADQVEQALRSTVLRATFDGEETVWCPLGDFFGSGVGLNALSNWHRAVAKDGAMACRWVMPYEKSGRLSVVNLGTQKVGVKLKGIVGKWKWLDNSMHFHATWRQQFPIPTRPFQDWNYVEVTGQGVYLGDTLSLMNPVRDWWGEGDEKIWVDGESFPSHFGTGSEDYYGYAWGNPSLFQGPFCNQVRCDGPGNLGHTVVTRTRSLDAIPFAKSLKMDMEVWHWKGCQVAYAVASYWYARPGAKSNRGPLPDEAARAIPQPPQPVKVKGALEGETLRIVERTGGVTETQHITQHNWSGDRQLWWRDAKPGDKLTFALPVPKAGKYSVAANLTKAVDYGIVQFRLDGEKLGEAIDLYNNGVVTTGPRVVGAATLDAGEHKLTVEITGSNPAAVKRHMFGLDYVKLDAAE
ncbi:MAG TPA: DUF2961 domain-containing protein [Planctomycetota bacterium]|nr:DUF2961 domain-containing protein [Planctomycetota bacterium]